MTLCSSWNCKCRFTMKPKSSSEMHLGISSAQLKAMHTWAWVHQDYWVYPRHLAPQGPTGSLEPAGQLGPSRSTKSTKSTSLLNPQSPSWIHCTGSADSIVHWLHWLHQIHQVNEVHNQPVLLVLSGPPSQWYLQAFYIVNDFLNWIIESQRTMLKIIVFLNDYSVILVLYDSWCS